MKNYAEFLAKTNEILSQYMEGAINDREAFNAVAIHADTIMQIIYPVICTTAEGEAVDFDENNNPIVIKL
jgi:hypothetical protein